MNYTRTPIHLILLSLGIIFTSQLSATEANNQSNQGMFQPNDIKWHEGPNSLPKGAEVALLEGNPQKSGPFTLRLKFPANYKIPPHFHPVIEHVTVLTGTFYMGMGDKLNAETARSLPTGSFVFMPAKMHHYAFTRDATIVQLHGVGPWGITYVNPKDDPRNNTSKHHAE